MLADYIQYVAKDKNEAAEYIRKYIKTLRK